MGCCLPRLPAMLLLALTAGCSTAARDDSAAPGRVWDVHARRFVGADAARRAAREANIVLLGETHDNLEHHRLQRELLAQIVATGRRPALVMEQFDREFQAPLDAARSSRERDADAVLDAGRFNRRSWQIQGYRPLVELALDFDLPIVAANLSRDEARAIVRDPGQAALPRVDPRVEQALAADIDRSHCGEKTPPAILAGMVAAQRARDLAMAQALMRYQQRGAVLVAGVGHVRADRGVPLYLEKRPLVIAFIEIDEDKQKPDAYVDGEFATRASFDFVWFTPRADRLDPCATAPLLQQAPKE
jgi:uncharacterized iron-regulated protein